MELNRAARFLGSAVLLVAYLWLGTSPKFYNEAMVSAFFGLAFASVAVIHLRVRPSLSDALAILACTGLLGLVDFQFLHLKHSIMAWVSFAGLSSLFVLGIRTAWTDAKDRKILLLAFLPAALFVVSEYYADDMLQWTSAMQPKVLDLYLYSFDGSLHIQFSFLLGQAFAKWPYLRLTSILFYISLAIPIALIYVGRLLRIGNKALASFLALLATGPIGILFYNLFPALGPAHVFQQEFPWQSLSTSQVSRLLVEPIAIAGPRNAIPSLHMTWVLLVWWYSRGLSWWERLIAFLFLIFTAAATMGTGEHYFIDLVVAFPFALMIEAIFAVELPFQDSRRITAAGFGLLTTLTWLLALRHATHFFWISPVLPWALCAMTIGVSCWLESRLQQPVKSGLAEAGAAIPEVGAVS